MKKINKKSVFFYSIYLVITWTLYRRFFNFSNTVEEFLIKPIVWLFPLFYLIKKEGLDLKSLGITLKRIFPSIALSLSIGSLFVAEALAINYFKYGGFNIGANLGTDPILLSLIISFATAFSEEIAFRGYIFTRFWALSKSELLANVMTTFVWTLIHVPVVSFVWHLSFSASLTYFFLTAVFGFGSAFIFARSKNIFSSILLHFLWEWPIILFR